MYNSLLCYRFSNTHIPVISYRVNEWSVETGWEVVCSCVWALLRCLVCNVFLLLCWTWPCVCNMCFTCQLIALCSVSNGLILIIIVFIFPLNVFAYISFVALILQLYPPVVSDVFPLRCLLYNLHFFHPSLRLLFPEQVCPNSFTPAVHAAAICLQRPTGDSEPSTCEYLTNKQIACWQGEMQKKKEKTQHNKTPV